MRIKHKVALSQEGRPFFLLTTILLPSLILYSLAKRKPQKKEKRKYSQLWLVVSGKISILIQIEEFLLGRRTSESLWVGKVLSAIKT